MGLKEWVAGVVIVSSVGVPTAHADDLHLHPEKHERVITTDNIGMVQTTGPVTKNGQERVEVGLSDHAYVEKIEQ